ncbi:MAG: hypothetical protein Q4C10_12095 [Clostridia bacterium]|nr:hypothetical protein [Clostridia bacterium]
MNERWHGKAPAIPEATPEFTDAILAGAEEIRRRERRRRRAARAALAVAACAVLALALGAALLTLRHPRQDLVVLAVNPEGTGTGIGPGAQEDGAIQVSGEPTPESEEPQTPPPGEITPEPEEAQTPQPGETTPEPEEAQTPLPGETTPEPEEAALQETQPPETSAPEQARDIWPWAQADDSARVGLEANENGVTTLLGQGPFTPGQRVVLTDEEGMLVYGLQIKMYEFPSLPSRSVRAVVGMQVVYLGDAGNGFARVSFAGREVYVEKKYLRQGVSPTVPEDGRNWVIAEAELFITTSTGAVELESIEEDTVHPYALKKLLCALEPADPADYADVPLGAVLLVFLRDADAPVPDEGGYERFTALRFAMPKNGAVALMTEDGRVFVPPEAEAPYFWSIFPATARLAW